MEEQLPPTEHIMRCTPDEWATMEKWPQGVSDDAEAFSDAARQLREMHPEGKNWAIAFMAKGDGALAIDAKGLHWSPTKDVQTRLELSVLLMDGSQVRVKIPFTRDGKVAVLKRD